MFAKLWVQVQEGCRFCRGMPLLKKESAAHNNSDRVEAPANATLAYKALTQSPHSKQHSKLHSVDVLGASLS